MALDRNGEEVKCQAPQKAYASMCLVCEQKIIVHCTECGIQISGCMCTLAAKIKKGSNA